MIYASAAAKRRCTGNAHWLRRPPLGMQRLRRLVRKDDQVAEIHRTLIGAQHLFHGTD